MSTPITHLQLVEQLEHIMEVVSQKDINDSINTGIERHKAEQLFHNIQPDKQAELFQTINKILPHLVKNPGAPITDVNGLINGVQTLIDGLTDSGMGSDIIDPLKQNMMNLVDGKPETFDFDREFTKALEDPTHKYHKEAQNAKDVKKSYDINEEILGEVTNELCFKQLGITDKETANLFRDYVREQAAANMVDVFAQTMVLGPADGTLNIKASSSQEVIDGSIVKKGQVLANGKMTLSGIFLSALGSKNNKSFIEGRVGDGKDGSSLDHLFKDGNLEKGDWDKIAIASLLAIAASDVENEGHKKAFGSITKFQARANGRDFVAAFNQQAFKGDKPITDKGELRQLAADMLHGSGSMQGQPAWKAHGKHNAVAIAALMDHLTGKEGQPGIPPEQWPAATAQFHSDDKFFDDILATQDIAKRAEVSLHELSVNNLSKYTHEQRAKGKTETYNIISKGAVDHQIKHAGAAYDKDGKVKSGTGLGGRGAKSCDQAPQHEFSDFNRYASEREKCPYRGLKKYYERFSSMIQKRFLGMTQSKGLSLRLIDKWFGAPPPDRNAQTIEEAKATTNFLNNKKDAEPPDSFQVPKFPEGNLVLDETTQMVTGDATAFYEYLNHHTSEIKAKDKQTYEQELFKQNDELKHFMTGQHTAIGGEISEDEQKFFNHFKQGFGVVRNIHEMDKQKKDGESDKKLSKETKISLTTYLKNTKDTWQRMQNGEKIDDIIKEVEEAKKPRSEQVSTATPPEQKKQMSMDEYFDVISHFSKDCTSNFKSANEIFFVLTNKYKQSPNDLTPEERGLLGGFITEFNHIKEKEKNLHDFANLMQKYGKKFNDYFKDNETTINTGDIKPR